MSDIDTTVANLKRRIEAATRARVRAEHELDAANAAAAAARKHLADEFGVTTVEQARTLHTQLTDDLNTAIATLCQQLDQIGV